MLNPSEQREFVRYTWQFSGTGYLALDNTYFDKFINDPQNKPFLEAPNLAIAINLWLTRN